MESICLNAICPRLGCRHFLVRQAIWRIAINHVDDVSNPAYTHFHNSYMLETIYRHCPQRGICWFAYWLPRVDFMPITSWLRLQGNTQKALSARFVPLRATAQKMPCTEETRETWSRRSNSSFSDRSPHKTSGTYWYDIRRGYCTCCETFCTYPKWQQTLIPGPRVEVQSIYNPAYRNRGTKVFAIRTSLQSSQGAAECPFLGSHRIDIHQISSVDFSVLHFAGWHC